MTDAPKLKNCPFCGESPRHFTDKDAWNRIYCKNDRCQIQPTLSHDYTGEAIAAWNKRHDPLREELGRWLDECAKAQALHSDLPASQPPSSRQYAQGVYDGMKEAINRVRQWLAAQGGGNGEA